MPIQAQSADGMIHEFPDGTDPSIVDKTMKTYAMTRVGPGKIPQQGQMGPAGQFFTGVGDIPAGARKLIAEGLQSPETAQKVETQYAQREADIARRGGGGFMRTVGQAAPGMIAAAGAPALAAAAPELLGGFGGGIGAAPFSGALGGAVSAALQPTPGTGADYWSQKQEDILLGSAFGLGSTLGLNAIGTLLSGVTDPAKKALMAGGVQLTPGQILGPQFRRAEEAFKSWPILGNFIRGAEGRGVEAMNRAVYHQVLEPLTGIPGVITKVDPLIQTGTAGIKFLKAQFDKAYPFALDGTKIVLDHDLGKVISAVRATAGELGADQARQFQTILDNRLSPLLRPMPGTAPPSVKTAMRDFRELKDAFSREGKLLLSNKLGQVQQALVDAVARQNPDKAPILRKVDQGYAMFARLRQAAARRKTSGGVFSPADLLSAVSSQDKTRGKTAFATGDALLQVYAQYAKKVLGKELPDSGTTERGLYDVALVAGKPKWALAAAAAGMPYTKPGMAAINTVAGGVPGMQGLGSIVRKAAPYAGTLGAGYATQPEPPYGGPQQ